MKKKWPLKRILAVLALIMIAALIVLLIAAVVLGRTEWIMPVIFCLVVIPAFIYVCRMVAGLLSGKGGQDNTDN